MVENEGQAFSEVFHQEGKLDISDRDRKKYQKETLTQTQLRMLLERVETVTSHIRVTLGVPFLSRIETDEN